MSNPCNQKPPLAKKIHCHLLPLAFSLLRAFAQVVLSQALLQHPHHIFSFSKSALPNTPNSYTSFLRPTEGPSEILGSPDTRLCTIPCFPLIPSRPEFFANSGGFHGPTLV